MNRWKAACGLLALVYATTNVSAQAVTTNDVSELLEKWKTSIEAFDFDAFAGFIADDAEITLTHPISRQIQQMTKQEYVDSLRPLAITYTGYVVAIESADIVVEGEEAMVSMRGQQTVSRPEVRITRRMESTLVLRLVDGRLKVVRSVTVPAEKADYDMVKPMRKKAVR